MNTPISSIVLVLIGTVLGAFGSLLLKKGSENFELSKPFEAIKNFKLIGGLLLYLLSSVLFIIALKSGSVLILYPLVSLGYLWICLLSVYFLKEKMNLLKWLGLLSIIIGVIIIGVS